MNKLLQRVWVPGIRIQLTLWYTTIFLLMIVLFSVIFYKVLETSLSASIDTSLQIRTQQIADGIEVRNNKITFHDVFGELPLQIGHDSDPTKTETQVPLTPSSNQSSVEAGTLMRIIDTQTHPVFNTPTFQQLMVPSKTYLKSLQGISNQETILARDGDFVRLYSVPLRVGGKIYGVLQVGQSLHQFSQTMLNVLIGLLLFMPLVLFCGILGSYWLAGRAMQPIRRLTQTAREIGEGDLRQRVPVPAARDEIQNLAQVFNQMIERLESSFEQQRRFVADASHELRTPVAAIRSLTDVALDQSSTNQEYREVINAVNSESERLGLLINNLLTLARADEGRAKMDNDEVRLDLLLADITETLRPLAEEHGITLENVGNQPISIHGDTARIIQVLISLVDNALNYTHAGGTVRLSLTTDEAYAYLNVQDSGIGIEAEDLPHIFERFYRADRARSRAAGGSGIGLSIVEWIVKAHQGTITVKSQPGVGSTFTVRLPLSQVEETASTETLSLQDRPVTGPLPQRR